MKAQFASFLLFITCLLGCSSCSAVFLGVYGIHKPKAVTEAEIIRSAKQYKIPLANTYELDASYRDYILTNDTSLHRQAMKNHLQPLQAIYYSPEGKMLSFQVNCYAGGYPNLKWERNGNMNTFPPKVQAPLDSLVPISMQFKFLLGLSNSAVPQYEPGQPTLIVFWSKFMGRQTKRFIRILQENAELAQRDELSIFYVNADNIFVEEVDDTNLME